MKSENVKEEENKATVIVRMNDRSLKAIERTSETLESTREAFEQMQRLLKRNLDALAKVLEGSFSAD